MIRILASFGIASMAIGAVLSILAIRRYGSADAPRRPTTNPKAWRLVYKSRSWFVTDRGFRLYVLGTELIGLGALIGIIVVWLF